jgi:predicted nucleotidyltransferase
MPSRYRNLDALHLPPRPPDAQEHLGRILDALVEDYGAQKIIAFGSCVRGGVTEHSDVDLCVIRRHPAGCTQPGLEADLAVARRRPLLSKDLLIRTPEQFAASVRRPFGVMEEVVRNGVVVYEG